MITDFHAGRVIGEQEFRTTMGRFASGLTVVASLDSAGEPAGRGSASWNRIEPTGRFGVSILAEEQQEVCAALGRRGADKFAGVSWQASAFGTVRIDGALATIDCRIESIRSAGDHVVVIGEVADLAVREDGEPLLYFRSSYGRAAR